VYNNLIHACIGQRQLSRALQLMESALRDKVRPDARTYVIMIGGCLAVGEAHDAAALLRSAMGLRGGHAQLAGLEAISQVPRGLSTEQISEILQDIADASGDERLALQLLQDLHRLPSFKLDARLSFKLTSKAIQESATW